MAFVQGVVSQLAPGRTQVPQLGLQHSSPTLQVLTPHTTLSGMMGMPHAV
ncbi:MAG TPA: hypothetical protein VFQ61_24115 [Polyangiaceae bacterium]|nr:hypothetical protein [Polyangiaceae bacterium]